MRWTRQINGHDIEIMEHFSQGGGVEEVVTWCHTCDPTGKQLLGIFDEQNYPKWRLAYAAAVGRAEEHAKVFPLT